MLAVVLVFLIDVQALKIVTISPVNEFTAWVIRGDNDGHNLIVIPRSDMNSHILQEQQVKEVTLIFCWPGLYYLTLFIPHKDMF